MALRPVQMGIRALARLASRQAAQTWLRAQLQPLLQLSSPGTSRAERHCKTPARAARKSSVQLVLAKNSSSRSTRRLQPRLKLQLPPWILQVCQLQSVQQLLRQVSCCWLLSAKPFQDQSLCRPTLEVFPPPKQH